MPSSLRKLGARMLSPDADVWNHKRRMFLLSPVWAVLGYTIGFYGGVHRVPSVVPDGMVPELFSILAIFVGSMILALVD